MQHNAIKYLYDMLNAIELIEQFLLNCTDFIVYTNDLKTKSAVERQLAIIGEAANKYEKNKPENLQHVLQKTNQQILYNNLEFDKNIKAE